MAMAKWYHSDTTAGLAVTPQIARQVALAAATDLHSQDAQILLPARRLD
jgi:hypothetical protein